MYKITDKYITEVISLPKDKSKKEIRYLNELYQYDYNFHKEINKQNREVLNKASFRIHLLTKDH